MKNYITLIECQQLGIDTVNNDRVLNAQKLVDELKPFIECEVLCSLYTEKDCTVYINYCRVVVSNKSPRISINKYYSGGKEKFNFHAFDLETLPNISRNQIQAIRDKAKEPQNMFVPSVKKIKAFVDYETTIYNDALSLSQKNSGEVETFLKSIEGLPVKWVTQNKSGEILNNGIVLEFQIQDGYVSEKIKVHYKVSDNVESFLALSNNQYNKK